MNVDNEIAALDENFYQFYYAYQSDWLERSQINFQAIQALWDILNNVCDNLDDEGVALPELQPALALVETMNGTLSELEAKTTPGANGLHFSGTREEYNRLGQGLLEDLYHLELLVKIARDRLIELSRHV